MSSFNCRGRGKVLALAGLTWLVATAVGAAEPHTASTAAPSIAYPEALDAAAIVQERLDNIMENSLIIGNGDINAVLVSRGSDLVLRLTKNDVWDARVDTSQDPPLLKIDVKNKKLDGPLNGPIPSWDKPYPCPRVCASLVLGGGTGSASWMQIRAEGQTNRWTTRDGLAVMSLDGRAGASDGFRWGPLDLSTDKYPTLRLKLSGTKNARYYVDLVAADNQPVFASKWIDSPAELEHRTYQLPPGRQVDHIILYTWTTDGQLAENRFAEVTFEGSGGRMPVNLQNLEAAPCRSQLDLRRATARVSASSGDATRATFRALAQRNAFLIHSDDPVRLEAVPAPYLPAAERGEAPGVQWLTQQLPADPDWPGMSFAVAVAKTGGRLAVAITTSLESKSPLEAAVALARSTLATPDGQLVAEHEAAWRQFWSASAVDLDDTALRDIWYRNLYFLRCVSKPGVEAIGLYAGLTNDNPPWHGSHTLNYNSEQTFWGSYVCNHVELAEPYERMIFRYLPRARWFAKQTYGIGGACIPHNVFTHEVPDPEKCVSKHKRMHAFPPYAYTIGVSGYAVQNIWLHYKYQPERQFLETTAYPAVRDVATFYADFIAQCEVTPTGKVVLAPSYSPEHWSLTPDFQRNRNCAFDIAFARFTLRAACEGAATLGCDRELAARFRQALARLPEYPTTTAAEPIVVDVQDAPPINFNIAVPVTPIFPGEQVTWFSPEAEKRLFTRTVEQVQWSGYNSSIILSVARARLSLPETWSWVKRELRLRSRPNGTITLLPGDGCGHFTEQFAASGTVAELLLQSVDDLVRIFPAWPADKPAKFEKLRAQGGFLVSAEQANGKRIRLEVTSTAGGRLRLLSPWRQIEVARAGGVPVSLPLDSRGVAELDTQPGDRLTFSGR